MTIVGLAATVGLAVGGSYTIATANDGGGTAPSLSKNTSGQKVGVYKLDAEKPDLIPAETDDGRPGYIYLSDLMWEEASTPEEAVELTQKHVNESGDVVVDVYEFDGVTKIGTFTAAHVDGVVAEE